MCLEYKDPIILECVCDEGAYLKKKNNGTNILTAVKKFYLKDNDRYKELGRESRTYEYGELFSSDVKS